MKNSLLCITHEEGDAQCWNMIGCLFIDKLKKIKKKIELLEAIKLSRYNAHI
jgi:hypothetical protein